MPFESLGAVSYLPSIVTMAVCEIFSAKSGVTLKTGLGFKLLSFWENCVFAFWRQDPRWRISAILDFTGPVIGSLESPCATFYKCSIDTIALNCLVFEKIALFAFWRQTDRQTDGQTDGQLRCVKQQSRYRELRLNKIGVVKVLNPGALLCLSLNT